MTARRGIFRRYAIAISSALCGTLLAAGLVEMAFAMGENIARAREFHVSEARAAFRRVSAILEEIERNFIAVSASPWAFAPDPAARSREYQRLMRLLPSVRDVTYARDGLHEDIFLSRSERNRFGSLKPVDAELARRAPQAGAVFGEVRHGIVGSVPYVQMALRDRGESPGVTLVTVNLQFMSTELSRMSRRGGEVAYVIDSRGALVAHEEVTHSRRANRSDLVEVSHAEREGSAWTRDERQDKVLSVWHRLDNPSWTLVVDSPWEQVLEPALATLYRTLALVMAGVFVSIGVAWALARRMARPVLALKDGAAAYSAGRLEHRIELATGDELQELAGEFNTMAEQIRGYTEGLERRVAEQTAELQDALALAQQAMRARALFLAAASHDLRQPLYAISLLADALDIEPLPAHSREVLAKQRQAIAVLRSLFDNLLDLSRFDAGEVRVRLRDFPLHEVLQPLSVECEMACRGKGLAWRADVGSMWTRSDPELLRRLVGNLLSNAIRYTHAGGVRLSTQVEGERVVIDVTDTGIGIRSEDQARVFDEFVQLANPARDRDQGVGLGLSIVKRISQLLEAPLELSSSEGVGTSVRIRVPVVPPVPRGPEIVAPTVPDSFPGLKIWIVEDDALVREALVPHLDAWGVEYAFADGWDALQEMFARDPGGGPDLVMLDDMLGAGPRGLELAAQLAGRMPRERIVLVTGNVDPERVRVLESSGFVVLHKPLSAYDIAAWIADATAGAAEADATA